MASNTLKLAFILSATDKMSRVVDQAVNKSTNKLSAFSRASSKVGRSAMKAGAVMVGAGTAVTGAMLGMAKSTANYGNVAIKTARSVGMGAEEWQKLAYAAKYAGVEEGKLSAAMTRFSKNINDASNGSGKAAQLFKEMGISVKDSAGNLRAPNDILAEVAERFKSTPDGAMKTAAAYDLLGRSGADMISLLNGGADGLDAMGKEAARLGLVISESACKASEKFVDDLDRVKDSTRGAMFQLGSALMPTIDKIAVIIQKTIEGITKWIQENPKLASTIGKVALGIGGLLLALGTLSLVAGAASFAIGALVSPIGLVVLAVAAVAAIALVIIRYWKEISAFFVRLWDRVIAAFDSAWLWIKQMFLNYTPQGLIIKHWDKISAFFVKLWDKVKETFSEAWQWIKRVFLNYTPQGLVIKHWDKISSFFVRIWDNVKGIFKATWDWIKNLFLKYHPVGILISNWEAVQGAFSKIWDGIKSTFSSGWDAITEFFSDLPSKVFEWGYNIVAGLWNGITSRVNKVVDGVKNIAQKIGNVFKSVLGINSPSRLFANYGVNLTQGLVVGIDRGGTSVENATRGMAARAAGGFSQSIGGDIVDASHIINGSSAGVNITYSPNITISGAATPETREEFGKLLRDNAKELLSIIQRESENRARLAFV